MTPGPGFPTLVPMSSSEHLRTGPSAFQPGFGLHPIMERAAGATSRQWRDAFVETAHASGDIVLRTLEDGRIIRTWNHLDNTHVIAVGEPVAVHERFGVLAVGRVRLSVRIVADS